MVSFLPKRKVAAILGVHLDTVGAMLDRGDLQGFRSGRLTRIRIDSLERLIGCRLADLGDPDFTEPGGGTPEDGAAHGQSRTQVGDDLSGVFLHPLKRADGPEGEDTDGSENIEENSYQNPRKNPEENRQNAQPEVAYPDWTRKEY